MNAPPPPILVSFGSVDALIEALPSRIREACEVEIRTLVGLGLPPAVSTITVSTLFGISADFVGAMSRAPQRYYRRFKIRKGKKTRQIEAPKVALKIIQRWIGAHLARATTLPDCVFGFVPGKQGVVEAAQLHCEAKWVYSVDLRDFFPSVAAARVLAALVTRGYSERAATLIVRLCTLDERLPQGSPASPVLSNLAFLPTDNALQGIATNLGVRYSRYADDLVFSGLGVPPDELVAQVHGVLFQHHWQIAEEKEHLARLPARLKVHGLLVHGKKPRLTKGYRNRVRAYRHLLDANLIASDDLATIRGHLAYAKSVDEAGEV